MTGPAATPSTTATSPPANGQARVSGLIASVSGNAVQLTREKGTTTVDFGPSTTVTEVTTAALTDVTAGSCISVRPARGESQGGQSITASSVRVSPAVDGKCPQLKEPPAGSSSPAPSGAPSAPSGRGTRISGTVASVAGNSITVSGTDSTSPTTLNVTDRTRYTKQAGSDTQAITSGKCMTALGTQDGSGALQATTINLRATNDGKCPGGEGRPHGHGG
jgi:hypothetical protein